MTIAKILKQRGYFLELFRSFFAVGSWKKQGVPERGFLRECVKIKSRREDVLLDWA